MLNHLINRGGIEFRSTLEIRCSCSMDLHRLGSNKCIGGGWKNTFIFSNGSICSELTVWMGFIAVFYYLSIGSYPTGDIRRTFNLIISKSKLLLLF